MTARRKLEIEQDLRFERRALTVQKVGWGLMLALLIVAATGVFGSGPVAHVEGVSPGGNLTIRHARFVTRTKKTDVIVLVKDGRSISLPQEYLEYARIENVLPAPVSSRREGEWLTFGFEAPRPLEVRFTFEAESTGSVATEFRAGDEVVLFRQTIYP